MGRNNQTLGEAELEIMHVLWNTTEAVTSTEIKEQLQTRRTQALSTLMSTLARLEKKGFVHCDRTTRTNYYHAIISEEYYKNTASKTMLQSLYKGSRLSMVSNLYRGKDVTEKDIQELKELIKVLETVEKND